MVNSDLEARARSLRASIAGLMRSIRRRIASAPRGAVAPPIGRPVDPFDLGTLDPESIDLALRVYRLRDELRELRGGDLSDTCVARCRDGRACRAPVVKERRRCRIHGGASTGPKTPEGRERCRAAAVAQRRGVPLDVALGVIARAREGEAVAPKRQ